MGNIEEHVKTLHEMHHIGVERMLFLARKVDPTVFRGIVCKVVWACQQRQSIDCVSRTHDTGEIHVSNNWVRPLMNLPHYYNDVYMLMVDCGPGKIATWWELSGETGMVIAALLNELFLEKGSVEEILMDNGTAFKSAPVKAVLDRWNCKHITGCKKNLDGTAALRDITGG